MQDHGDGARALPRDVHAFLAGDFRALDAEIAERSVFKSRPETFAFTLTP